MSAAELITVLKSINESVAVKCRDRILHQLSEKKASHVLSERELFWAIDQSVQQLVNRITNSLLTIKSRVGEHVVTGLLQEFSVHCSGYNQLKQGVYDQHLVKTERLEDVFGVTLQRVLAEELEGGHNLLDGIYADALSEGSHIMNNPICNGRNVQTLSMNGNPHQNVESSTSIEGLHINKEANSSNTDGTAMLNMPKQLNLEQSVEIDQVMAMMEEKESIPVIDQGPSMMQQNPSELLDQSPPCGATVSDDTTLSVQYAGDVGMRSMHILHSYFHLINAYDSILISLQIQRRWRRYKEGLCGASDMETGTGSQGMACTLYFSGRT